MPAPATFPRGRFVWHELTTTDPDAAVGFYTKVVGWKVQAWEHDPSYRLWMGGGSPMGGLMRLSDEARRKGTPSHWMPYIAVPDVDATVRQAQGLGARVHAPPRDIPVGRFASLADPQGAAFSVYKPAPGQPFGSDDVGVGDFSWHELVTTDWKRAWDFYRALFGWEHASSIEMGPGNTYWMFKRGGGTRTIGGMYNKPADMPAPPHWLSYVLVPSADRAAKTAARAGGKIVMGPMDVPGGDRIAGGLDPQGAGFAVHAKPAPAVKAAAGKKRAPVKKRKASAKKTTARRARPKRRR
jgi:uncharacterized protein